MNRCVCAFTSTSHHASTSPRARRAATATSVAASRGTRARSRSQRTITAAPGTLMSTGDSSSPHV
ncbi:hypothetical protein B6D25_10875 [Micrococcus luteus]|nr:hypothetical protein BF96_10355 [Micrococcus luteus]ORE57332.1 hypothetical protein B6D25_10875 [Micrococcus luteus]RFP70512.1 hypothetical protein D0N42_07995 [Micrococcus luteus]